MPSSVAALLAAVFIAAAPDAAQDAVASADELAAIQQLPAEQLQDVTIDALPPPPRTVVRVTTYYGQITIDHRAHLQRHAACKRCHGPGPITKLVFTPKVAHDRCVGCHREFNKGPVNCQGCHVKTIEKPKPIIAAAAVPTGPPPPPEPSRANLAAAFAAFDKGPARDFRRDDSIARWLELGFAGGAGQGFSVRVASRLEPVVITQSVDRLMSGSQNQTLGLLGAGFTRPIRGNVAFEATALAGVDIWDKPLVSVLPTVGARAGVQWFTRFRFFRMLTASVTAAYDLGNTSRFDHEVGGATIYGTIGTGFWFPAN